MTDKEFADALKSDAGELVKVLTAALQTAERLVITSEMPALATQDLGVLEVELSTANRLCKDARKLFTEKDASDLLESEPASGRNAL